jgi:hypothetical protein
LHADDTRLIDGRNAARRLDDRLEQCRGFGDIG